MSRSDGPGYLVAQFTGDRLIGIWGDVEGEVTPILTGRTLFNTGNEVPHFSPKQPRKTSENPE